MFSEHAPLEYLVSGEKFAISTCIGLTDSEKTSEQELIHE